MADSKKLSEVRRESLFIEICEKAIAFGIGRAEVFEIDRINIMPQINPVSELPQDKAALFEFVKA